MRIRTFVDRGGTFTDVVIAYPDGRLEIKKIPSNQAVIGDIAHGEIRFGTTVATNALLERKGVRSLLLVTEGFRDLVCIGDMSRPNIFDPHQVWPKSLAVDVREIPGRIDAQGLEREPIPDIFWEEMALWDWTAIDSVAIALLNSPRNPKHEKALSSAVPESLFRSLGHCLSPAVDYLARIETTVIDAAITPLLQAAIRRDKIPKDALAIRSDGSLCPTETLRAPDAVLSGEQAHRRSPHRLLLVLGCAGRSL